MAPRGKSGTLPMDRSALKNNKNQWDHELLALVGAHAVFLVTYFGQIFVLVGAPVFVRVSVVFVRVSVSVSVSVRVSGN